MSLARREAAAQVLVEDPAAPELASTDRHHLVRVLRLHDGERVVAADGRGRWSPCRIVGDALEVDGPVVSEPAPGSPVSVAFAPVKGERPEWVVQKLTELGVDRVAVVRAARTVVRWEGDRAEAALERLRRVAAEAACQARRAWLPEVVGIVSLSELPGALGGVPVALGEPGAPALDGSVRAVAVGPEGGWAPEELALGWPLVGLGEHVLRSETAAIAAGTLLVAWRAATVGRR